MAAVFLAEHIALRRPVALKILHPPPDADETGNYAQRFRLEAETLATLDHPNIVTLYDYGPAEDGRFYLAMEYIEGPRYTDILAGGALDPERTIRLILQVCAALRYAHKRKVIHRDLKPSNLLIRTDAEGVEQVKVVDFGLVKVVEVDQALTREGLVLGSPHCMAPEQVRGSTDIDHRADIYAIGILLFRSLTGAYPFHGSSSTATMVAHLNEPIPSFAAVAPGLAVPGALEAVVRRCLAKRPDERYPDVKALMADLAACSADAETQSLSGKALAPGQSMDTTVPAPPTLVPPVAVESMEAADPAVPSVGQEKRGSPVLLLLILVALLLGGVGVWALVGGGGDAPGEATTGTPPGPVGASSGDARPGPGAGPATGEGTPPPATPSTEAPAEGAAPGPDGAAVAPATGTSEGDAPVPDGDARADGTAQPAGGDTPATPGRGTPGQKPKAGPARTGKPQKPDTTDAKTQDPPTAKPEGYMDLPDDL
jgi:serine/threonine-protein kinase